jgi:thiamine-monophosphate kinase
MPARPSEFELIERLFAPLATDSGAFGLADDACVLSQDALSDVVVTTDGLVEGVHFLSADAANLIARKTLRVNLSDLAAKGAKPAGYLLALSLPERIGMDWLEEFARGLKEDQSAFTVSLLGGDTTATPGPLSLVVTAFGHVPRGRMIRRSGAKAGDGVFVSGTVGDAGAGLEMLSQGATAPRRPSAASAEPSREARLARAQLIDRYHLPMPRLALGQVLRGVATAALDVSDGLIADLGHIADVSGVRIVLEAEKIPLSPAYRSFRGNSEEAVVRAATSGDDYEIAFTAPAVPASLAAEGGVPVTRIGRVEAGAGVVLTDSRGREIPVPRAGFRHF